MAPKKMERGSYPIFLESFFIFIFGFLFCASGVNVRGFHGYGAPHIQELRVPPIEKGVFCLVVDIVFEGIEELKGEFGQPSD